MTSETDKTERERFEAQGPYHYAGDVHPSLNIRSSTGRIVGCIYIVDDDMDRAEAEADACVLALDAEHGQARAALDTGAVPEGWKLVPVEPTDEMVKEGVEWFCAAAYRRMVAAAPHPPASTVVDHEQRSVSSNDACVSPVIDNAASASAGRAPVAYIQAETLDALRNDKMATTTVASGLLRKPFGSPVPLYTSPPAQPVAALTEVQWLKKRTGETGRALKGRERDEFLSLMRFAERALQAQPATPAQPDAYRQGAEEMREQCIRVVAGGYHLSKDSPSAQWARDIERLIRALPLPGDKEG